MKEKESYGYTGRIPADVAASLFSNRTTLSTGERTASGGSPPTLAQAAATRSHHFETLPAISRRERCGKPVPAEEASSALLESGERQDVRPVRLRRYPLKLRDHIIPGMLALADGGPSDARSVVGEKLAF